MTSLVSASQMNALRSVAELGMQSTVIITRHTYDDTNPYTDDEVVITTTTKTVKGWLRSTPVGDINNVNGQQAVVPNSRLFVPVGTDIRPRDTVTIDGNDYTVQDATTENTWKVLIRAQLERVE